jgi:RNA polymerase sigma-70 factor (ECF subfamily)
MAGELASDVFEESQVLADADAQMMLCAREGDASALDVLVEKHRGRIVHFVYRMVRDYAISEEIAQEVFLRVHRYREGYQATAKFTTWLCSIAGHLALNWLRDNQHERLCESIEVPLAGRPVRQLPDPNIRIDEWLEIQRRVEEVRRAVSELPERQRTVVLMHKFEGIGCEEIAAMLGCSHQAVRSLLCRAYTTLRVRLA